MTRKVNIMTNVVKGDQVKDSYGKIYDVIEVHEHNVMVLEPGKPYWERICMGRFDFDSYFRRADEPMTDDMQKISMRTKRKKNKIYCGWLLSAAFLLHKNATEIFSPWRFSLGGIAPFMLFLLRSFLCRADNTCPFWQ